MNRRNLLIRAAGLAAVAGAAWWARDNLIWPRPDLTGHVLMLEDVAEPLYRIDRMMFHLTGQASIRRVAGIRLGRVSDIVENDPDFGLTAEEIVRYWCARSGIPWLGTADIGHDTANRIVPFGPR